MPGQSRRSRSSQVSPQARPLVLPASGLVLLVGASSAGKSTFAARNFTPTEIVSSDRCRGLVGDDDNDQSVSAAAFKLLHTLVGLRLSLHKMTVVDATNLRANDRKRLRSLAREHDCLCSALLFDTPPDLCRKRNAERHDRELPSEEIARQLALFRQACHDTTKERYHLVHVLSPEDATSQGVVREPLEPDRRALGGPFDIIGDLHGCAGELRRLLGRLGYGRDGHPQGRTAIFLGDLTDRGPRSLECCEIVCDMLEAGQALAVIGNHDDKLIRWLEGRKVVIGRGLETTHAELSRTDQSYRQRLQRCLERLASHYVLDGGRLVVAHAGLKEQYHGRVSDRVRRFCLYGDITGELDDHGLPVRLNWAAGYRGRATVVYGHTPVRCATWLNRTINIDTGCVFGGKLTALRYPELELVEVPAEQTYAVTARWLTGEPESVEP